MTATERAKRSDALYYETVSVTRRVLCDMIANREADLEDAQAENAKLRESVRRLMTQRDERLARAETDNAKLRELVSILAYCMSEGCDCDRCALNGADMPTPRISACDELPDMLRELRVEVAE